MQKQKKPLGLLAPMLVLLGLMSLGLPAPAGAADSQVAVVIDGTSVAFTQETGFPFLDGASRTQVPLRATMEAYGCTVQWDNDTRAAVVQKDGVTVQAPIGQPYIRVNGSQIPNDTAALVQNGRTYLPIRAVLEAFGGYVAWDGGQNAVVVDTSSPVLRVHFLDVGQGDAIFLDLGETEVLIDGGEPQAGGNVVSAIAPYVDGDLDYLVATHPDADHIGGLDEILAAYGVGEVIDSGYPATTATYRDYLTAVQAEPGCVLSYDETRSIPLGSGASLQVIETGDDAGNPNDSSVITQLTYGDTTVLFTGDMSQGVETACLDLFSQADVLKVGHHGSAASTCDAFLDVVRPTCAVVSYGVGNSYGHPAADTLTRLLHRGVTVYGTGKSGAIVLSTNGRAYNFNVSAALDLTDAGGGQGAASSGPAGGVTRAEAACAGSANTKKYHTFTCRYASQISPKNLIYFTSDADAQAAGYAACKVCHCVDC